MRSRNGSGLKRLGGTWGEVLAEFLGTFVLISFGDGVVAMAVAALPGSGRAETNTTIFLAAGDWLLIAWGWAFAVAFAVYIAGGVSGAHLNPAITLAFAVRRKFAWAKVLPYMAAQVVGAFAGAALVYLAYHDAIDAYNKATKTARDAAGGLATYSIFATFPAPYFNGNMTGPFIDQVVGTHVPGAAGRGGHRHAQQRREGEPRTARGRFRRRGDRNLVRRQRRIRDQPGP